MDEGRLGFVRKRENNHRKYVYIVNDVIKSKWGVLDEHIAREKIQHSLDWEKSTMSVRRILIRQKVLKQCMKMRRDGVATKVKERMLGYYGGKPIHAFTRDIDQQIADNHPRLRRMRKVRKQIQESIVTGKILKPVEMSQRMNNYFEKHFKEEEKETKKPEKDEDDDDDVQKKDIFSRHRGALPPIRGLVNPFYKVVRDDDTKPSETSNQESGQESVDRLVVEKEQEKPEKELNKHVLLPKIKEKETSTARTVSPEKSLPKDQSLRLEKKVLSYCLQLPSQRKW
ncbi:uncharacterized protein LOC117322129 [Pecten maximus]|uniref:uncharacterized protein LOC117322129 n=1 Tax=Pecten maximus TaxID=6579 RepID=UPI001458230B|nr:uncharacterized protein LOC117322129 [Pecten maximus]XP_033732785.1 uncharacterized protein LOC117322129 [Pecten maximus]XP_033732786.1 uncharacterized protein LOC117322129 [Pecten maximus]XP_033732787.1 uncharacterized protein LOC117322129 [Pecten maximus]